MGCSPTRCRSHPAPRKLLGNRLSGSRRSCHPPCLLLWAATMFSISVRSAVERLLTQPSGYCANTSERRRPKTMAISEGSISVNLPSASPAILPLKVIYTPGQTAREASSDQSNAVLGVGDFTLVYVNPTPNELWFGAVASDYHVLSHADSAQAASDFMGNLGSNDRSNIFFRLTAGVWRFSGQLALPGAQRGDVWRVNRVLTETHDDETLAQSHSRPVSYTHLTLPTILLV